MIFNTQRGATFHISGYQEDEKSGPLVGVSFWGSGISVNGWITPEEAYKLAAKLMQQADFASQRPYDVAAEKHAEKREEGAE